MREAAAWKQKSAPRVATAMPLEGNGPPPEAALSQQVEVLKETTLSLLQEVDQLRETMVQVETFRKIVSNINHGINFYEEVRRFEIELIRRALEHTGGHQSRAAALLQLKLTTLNEMIKRYQLLNKHDRASNEATPDEEVSSSSPRLPARGAHLQLRESSL